ncbi:MAG: hypothetical protein EU521_01545 [Promethearchaeota archaeon]|nr:MAG: hypothetical protein EU521_01545 [Candidatus Lokiarchaeota archaeon]
MSNIYITNEDLEILKKALPSLDEDIIYATYALIAHKAKIIYRWDSPIIITNKRIIFYQPAHSNLKAGINQVPLYKTHVFNNYKHIYISVFDFWPKYKENSGESKSNFKSRWKQFQKIILPYIINNQEEHLEVIKANKDNKEFYNKKDLKQMPWFGTEKALEKNIRKLLPNLEKKL